MNTAKVISIAGYDCSGKSTVVAKGLEDMIKFAYPDKPVYRMAFADELRLATHDCLVTLGIGQLDPWKKPTSPEMRKLLIAVSAVCRSVYDGRWADALAQRIADVNDQDCFVILDDTRYLTDLRIFRLFQGISIFVQRDGIHENRYELPEVMADADYIMDNNVDKDSLEHQVAMRKLYDVVMDYFQV